MSFDAVSIFAIGDEAGEQNWATEHYYEHLNFNGALYTLGYSITNYPIQVLRKDQVWLDVHQSWHQAIATAIAAGTAADMSTLDWKKPDQVEDWLQLHASVHDGIRTTLGL